MGRRITDFCKKHLTFLHIFGGPDVASKARGLGRTSGRAGQATPAHGETSMRQTVRNSVLVIALFCLAAGRVSAQENATLLMRSGERLDTQLIDMGGAGFNVLVSGQERQIPLSDVAAIEFGGEAAGLSTAVPAEAARRAADGRHTIWLRNGDLIEGQLYDIDGPRPLQITVRTDSGERRLSSSEIRRIVLALPVDPIGTIGKVPVAPAATGIDVPGSAGWIPTGLVVRRGEVLIISSTGQVQLSGAAEDVAGPSGARSQRVASDAPLPGVSAGTLIAKIDDGAPFSIADSASATMPAAGQLFLGVNDGRLADNTGSFRVSIQRSPAR